MSGRQGSRMDCLASRLFYRQQKNRRCEIRTGDLMLPEFACNYGYTVR